MRLIPALLLFIALPGPGLCADIHVPDQYATIQHAIEAAKDGDTILVRPGTYREHLLFMGKVITVKGLEGPEKTILDGNQFGTVVRFDLGEGPDSVLTGFTVTNGKADAGAGVYCYLSSPTITGNTFEKNHALFDGGAIACNNSNPVITGNLIQFNSAGWNGGGIFSYNGKPMISDNLIHGNRTLESHGCGGGIFCDLSDAKIVDNIITRNVSVGSDGRGGGIGCRNASPGMEGNSISGNAASGSFGCGGGIFCENASPRIKDNTLEENEAKYRGGGIYCEAGSAPVVSGNTLWGNATEGCGGGIFCKDASPVILDNTLQRNEAQGSHFNKGGGIGCHGASPMIRGNRILENSAEGGNGGGISCTHGSVPRIIDNTIAANSARGGGGGGVSCTHMSEVLLNRNTIVGNRASQGGGIYCYLHASSTVTNTILWNNLAKEGTEIFLTSSDHPSTLFIRLCDVKGGSASALTERGCLFDWGEGMIDSDPLFADPERLDFRLTPESPCLSFRKE